MISAVSFVSYVWWWMASVCIIIECVDGWGPYTHAGCGSIYYQKRALSSSDNGSNAYNKKKLRGLSVSTKKDKIARATDVTTYNSDILEAVFVTANTFPDAFKYTRDWMHTLEYAAFQVERATVWSQNQKGSTGTANIIIDDDPRMVWNNSVEFIQTDIITAFSYGYLLHLMEDYVGHHKGGYLTPKKDHQLELDVDTLVYLQHEDDGPPWYYRDAGMATIQSNQQLRHEIALFVSDTSQLYASNDWKQMHHSNNITAMILVADKHETGITTKEIEDCIQRFTKLVRLESVAMQANSKIYQAGMVRYDVCDAPTFTVANATLQKALEWTERSLDILEEALFPFSRSSRENSTGNKVLDASELALAWIDQAFELNGGSICGNAAG